MGRRTSGETARSLRELAERAGVSHSTAARWRRRGLVVPAPSGGYDVAATLERVKAARDRDAVATKDMDLPDLARLKARVLEERAALLALERKEREGELVPVDEVRRFVAGEITAARARILAAPQRLRQRHPEVPLEVYRTLEALLREALEELSAPERAADEVRKRARAARRAKA